MSSLILSPRVIIVFTHRGGFRIYLPFQTSHRPFCPHLQQTILLVAAWQHGSQFLQAQSFPAMDKTPHSVKGDPSVKGVTGQLLIDLNEMPDEVEMVDLDEQPMDDVPPPPPFYIDLCFHKEDMEVLKQKYKVLGLSSVADSDHFKNLGFLNGCNTVNFIRHRRVQFPGKSLLALGRSWFKGVFSRKDKQQDVDCMKSFPEAMCVEVRKGGDKEKEKRNDDDADDLAAKELLRDFVKQAKDRARNARKKGKKVQKQQQDVDYVKSLPEPMCVEVSKEGDKDKEKINDDDADHLAAKELLRDFVKQAKARARNARKKGKMVQKQVHSTSTPCSGKKKNKFVPKMRSLNAIMSNNKLPNA